MTPRQRDTLGVVLILLGALLAALVVIAAVA